MQCVSCCELCVRSKHDPGNHCVAQFARTSLFMTHRHQIPSLLRRGCIKRSYTTLDLLKKNFLECLKQGRASLANRQNLQSVTNFKDRDGSCPNGCARLLVEPFDNTPAFVGSNPTRRPCEFSNSLLLAFLAFLEICNLIPQDLQRCGSCQLECGSALVSGFPPRYRGS